MSTASLVYFPLPRIQLQIQRIKEIKEDAAVPRRSCHADCLTYRFYDVQFSSDVANVRCANQPNSSCMKDQHHNYVFWVPSKNLLETLTSNLTSFCCTSEISCTFLFTLASLPHTTDLFWLPWQPPLQLKC